MRGNIDWIPCKEGQMPEKMERFIIANISA